MVNIFNAEFAENAEKEYPRIAQIYYKKAVTLRIKSPGFLPTFLPQKVGPAAGRTAFIIATVFASFISLSLYRGNISVRILRTSVKTKRRDKDLHEFLQRRSNKSS